ncbi:MAG TPA: hypothetical protein VKU19_15250 [Bryobacteraceae bacterium]|nr:hypothetical protein [Bryobacteraceae bacterium]
MTVKKISLVGVLAVAIGYPIVAHDKAGKADAAGSETVVIWRNPTDLASRDLFYGPGGREHQPHGAFTFVKEDLDGTNPKFVVKDADGVEWKVKLGLEARPETVASRLVWAAGYFTNEDYFLATMQIQGLPERLHRGRKLISPDGTVHNVRLKREIKANKKEGTWQWKDNPFVGTREINGLKVMMAVVNNWDLKDENNAVYRIGAERVYMVSDLGASFGTDGRSWPPEKTKGNLTTYEESKFVRDVTDNLVDFRVPGRPKWVCIVNPKEYFRRIGLESIGHRIPREDARWMGELLSHLSQNQLRDAFRSAGYTPAQVEGFTEVVRKRIGALTDL